MRHFKLFILLLSITQELCYANNNLIEFEQSCAQGQQITIAAMGDLLLHHPLQVKASHSGFKSLWQEAIPYIKHADIAYANLEGPIAPGISQNGSQSNADPLRWDYKLYSDYPLFNYHPQLAQDLKQSGFTLLSTANNHAFDRKAIGVDKTLETLDKIGIAHVGSRKSNSDQEFVKIIESRGIKLAWIACTEHTNGATDEYHQIRYCYKPSDKQWILNTIQSLKSKVDAIIVAPHWGVEYQEKPNQSQTTFAKQMLDAGAIAIIGSHPHVLQPVEKYLTKDGRATLISYSLGNFVSFQGSTRTRSTIILLIGLTRTMNGTIINGVRFVPMYMMNRSGTDKIHLSQLTPKDKAWPTFGYIARAIPLRNAIYELPIVTNPSCQKNLND
ncbi:MAG: CapA family protein [Proteobacteria bacterium]|nr:CapA family protein [Pseudomonadota bacterium]